MGKNIHHGKHRGTEKNQFTREGTGRTEKEFGEGATKRTPVGRRIKGAPGSVDFLAGVCRPWGTGDIFFTLSHR